MAWAHGSPWAFVALLPLFASFPRLNWKEGFRCGWVTGSVFSLYSLYWVAFTQGGGPAVVAGTLLMAAYIGVFYGLAGAGLSAAVKAWPHAGWLTAPLLWTAAEYLLSLGELGFPWLLLGSTQAVTVELIQYAEITGVYGVSFWVSAVNVVLWLTLRSPGLRQGMAGAAALLAPVRLPLVVLDRDHRLGPCGAERQGRTGAEQPRPGEMAARRTGAQFHHPRTALPGGGRAAPRPPRLA